MSERIDYASDMQTIVSWLRYEYDGLNLLRIDERYDGESPAGLDENDPWRPLNVFIHGPGAIGQIVKSKWYNYYSDGQDPANCCDSGEYYYFYDALGNVNGVLDSGGHYYRWEMDAFGNDLPSGNDFLPMDQPGPKEHLTGKMFDTTTGLYYFAARWYDPQVGRFVSRDPEGRHDYFMAAGTPTTLVDPSGLGPICQGQDLHWVPCTDILSKKPRYECCSLLKLQLQLANSKRHIKWAKQCLQRADPSDPSCHHFAPPPDATVEQIENECAGVTQAGVGYCNPNHPKTDECGCYCVCVHERVHVGQGPWKYAPSDPRSILERAQRELPAYTAGADCEAEMIRRHGWKMQKR